MKYKVALHLLAGALFANAASAQIFERPEKLKNIDINLLLRSSLEVPDRDQQAGFKLNEARFEITGNVIPDLDFRLRYRVNRPLAPRGHDNSPGAIDHASVNYKFGTGKKWSVNVGKQAAHVGSWEFETNPTYEYQYSEFVNQQTNIFLMAARFGYQVNDNHSVYVQLHNTYNEGFDRHLATTTYTADGETGAKTPMGIYTAWQGKLFDKKLHTFWSYNISQYEKNGINHAVAIGNKVILNKFQAYLDLQSATLGLDYPNIVSPSLNNYRRTINPTATGVFAKDVNYKSAILRLDYQFVPGWFVTAKGFYETASQRKDNSIAGKNFRQNIGYLTGLEYKPFEQQNFKVFGYYYHNRQNYDGVIATANDNKRSDLFAAGFLYFINTFR